VGGALVSRTAPSLPGVQELEEARARLRGIARHTPLHHSPWLSDRAGAPVHLKLECWQVTHSFKVRGAYNAIAALGTARRAGGLTTASAGNHGLAVAHAARLHGTRATIFVPAAAPEAKRSRIRRLGAELREVTGSYDDAAVAAREYAAAAGAHLVHGFNDPAVVAGQGTVGLEIVEDLPDVREVLVPVGGGGLAAGVGAALQAGAPGSRLLGVQSTATRAMYEAFGAGGIAPFEDGSTLCDGLAGETEAESYVRARAALSDLRLVDEAVVGPAIRALFENEGIVAEGSGVVGIAALLAGTWRVTGPVVVVVSGGNIDAGRLSDILKEA
jgi:threonine dehydratase